MLQQCLGIAIPSPWGGLGKGSFFSQSHKDRKGLTHSHTSRSFLCFLCVAARSSRLLSLRNLCDLSVFASESSPLAVITPPSPLGEGQGVRLNRFFGHCCHRRCHSCLSRHCLHRGSRAQSPHRYGVRGACLCTGVPLL